MRLRGAWQLCVNENIEMIAAADLNQPAQGCASFWECVRVGQCMDLMGVD